jgi:hypothetical protein
MILRLPPPSLLSTDPRSKRFVRGYLQDSLGHLKALRPSLDTPPERSVDARHLLEKTRMSYLAAAPHVEQSGPPSGGAVE